MNYTYKSEKYANQNPNPALKTISGNNLGVIIFLLKGGDFFPPVKCYGICVCIEFSSNAYKGTYEK